MKEPRHLAVAIAFDEQTHRVLMISSRKHPHLWILPKGGIEKGETSLQAAIRESWEEAGTPQKLTLAQEEKPLLVITLNPVKDAKRGADWHIHVLRVQEAAVDALRSWPEAHERRREWISPDECLLRIQAWYSDSSAKNEVRADDAMVSESHLEKLKKKDKKGGAMEMALRAFAEQYGWSTVSRTPA